MKLIVKFLLTHVVTLLELQYIVIDKKLFITAQCPPDKDVFSFESAYFSYFRKFFFLVTVTSGLLIIKTCYIWTSVKLHFACNISW